MKNTTRRLILFVLILTVFIGTTPLAQARASDYLNSYFATPSKNGSNLKIEFRIDGTGTMTTIGAKLIYLYEKTGTTWHLVETFDSATTAGMLKSNSYYQDSYVTYSSPVSGKQYYAVMHAYAAKGSGSDTKTYASPTITF